MENLFYRTPARLKHLRSGAYENSLVQDVIMKFAMSHPEIAFRFVSSGREAFRTSGSGDLREVIFQCWGKEAAEAAIPVSFSDFDYQDRDYQQIPDLHNPKTDYPSTNCDKYVASHQIS